MEQLSLSLLHSDFHFPEDIQIPEDKDLPETVLQFGSGNFLRGFADWMLQKMNDMGLYNGKAVIVQSVTRGMTDKINLQNGLYTLYLRGIQNGNLVESKEIIRSVSRTINAVDNFDEFLRTAENPDMRICISNTTEAGIQYVASDRKDMSPPSSFPGKLTVFLHHRFCHFNGDSSKGMLIVPCELIENNGTELCSIVLRYAKEWDLGDAFIAWVKDSCEFVNTLVDRIVTGYPKDEIDAITKENGYTDTLLDTAEIYHSWVIEGAKKLKEEFPLEKAGFNVTFTDDLDLYRTRKVRILNGAHTMTVLGAYLAGKDTVKECLDDTDICNYIKDGLTDEIIPTIPMAKEELTSFANDVLERFANPFIRHYLLSISLNSVSKWKTRVLPSVNDYVEKFSKLPRHLTFSLAALLAFYRGTESDENGALNGHRSGNTYPISDSPSVLEFFKEVWSVPIETEQDAYTLCEKVLSNQEFWGQDLTESPDFTQTVSEFLYKILKNGVRQTLKEI